MSAWNLAWIVPLCISFGYVVAALLFAASARDGDTE